MNESMKVLYMFTQIATVGGVGFALTTAFEWFHSKEIKIGKKVKKEVKENDGIKNLRQKLES
ncbi:hypothetical protein [Halobacillus litoralis]|uniref:hypothetical protein n=1 Tax=Halobacillus litoralis TaxID=45668 RepID=UPI001CD4DC30|nr:hypothetical protein [Halobacillus litoralis]MCA1021620.1 hypothetical protein [Halobacillus litoralis]